MTTSLIGGAGLRGPTSAGQRIIGPYQGQKIGGGYRQGQLNNFTPEQMQLFQSLFSHVSPDSQTSRLAMGDENAINAIEAPALRQFNQQLGNIASRFTGAGGAGSLSSRNSSGFQNAVNQASSNFAQDLQAQRQQLQRQALQDLLNMSNTLFSQKPFENFAYEPQQKKSFLQQLMGALGPIAGAGIGGLFGGMPGAQLGGSIGSAFSQNFR